MLHTVLGRLGEDFACKKLQELGYTIILRNFRTKLGEIDIISTHKNSLIFTEVKTRKNTKFGYPEEAVNKNRLKRIANAGQIFIKKYKIPEKLIKVEVVSIIADEGEVKRFKIINAFS